MQNNLFWVGAGDLAQRCVSGLDRSAWHCTALKRHCPTDSVFDQIVLADVTLAESLQNLPQASHIIYSVTPSERSPDAYQAVYDSGLKHLLASLDLNALQRFVFISSTSVYGPDPVPQDESSMLKPTSFSGQTLHAAEKFLQQELKDKLTVIRFSGLYGPGRQRIFNSLRQQSLSLNPAMDNYANRIHSDDAARVCAHVLHHAQPHSCYVATDSTPLPLRQLYSHLSQRLKVPAPRFDAQQAYESKHFSNQRLLNSGFDFLYPSTLQGYDLLLDSLASITHES